MTQPVEAARWRGTARPVIRGALGFVPFADGLALPARVLCELTGADDVAGRWPDIVLTFEVRNGVPMCTGMAVTSKPGDREVRPDFLAPEDVIRLGDHAFVTFALQQEADGGFVSHGPVAARSVIGRAAQRAVSRAQAHAASAQPEELRSVARVWLDPANAPKRTDAVWKMLGYGSRETASRRVRAAREAGLIPPPRASAEQLSKAWERLQVPRDDPYVPQTPEEIARLRVLLDEWLSPRARAEGGEGDG